MSVSTSRLLTTLKHKNQEISVYWHDNKPTFILNTPEQTVIQNYNIAGIPQDIKSDPDALTAFLENTYIYSFNESSNGDIKFTVSPRLQGGANIINPRTEPGKLWRGGIIPFEINSTEYPIGQREREIILEAVREFNALNTGFTLVPHTHQPDYLIFGSANGVCHAHVGRQGGPQYVRCDLSGGGFNKRSITHEILHTVGFHHEHQRADRDDHVTARPNRTRQDSVDYGKQGNAYGRYDFNSIMHYHFDNKLQPKRGVISSGAEYVGTLDNPSQGDIEAARYLASFARQLSPATPRASRHRLIAQQQPEYERLIQQALAAFSQENFLHAFEVFTSLITEYGSVFPREIISHWFNQSGRCLLQAGDFESAHMFFREAINRNRNNVSARDNYAETLATLGMQELVLELDSPARRRM